MVHTVQLMLEIVIQETNCNTQEITQITKLNSQREYAVFTSTIHVEAQIATSPILPTQCESQHYSQDHTMP